MERHGARADGGQQVVGVLRGHDQDQVRRRLFQRLQQRVGGLLVGAVHVVDQEDAAAAVVRQERRALLEQARLRDGDLAQRAIGREGDEIGMGGEEQRIFVALLGGPFFAAGDDFEVVRQAEVVVLDLLGVAEQARAQAAGQRGFADALRARRRAASAPGGPARSSARALRVTCALPQKFSNISAHDIPDGALDGVDVRRGRPPL